MKPVYVELNGKQVCSVYKIYFIYCFYAACVV